MRFFLDRDNDSHWYLVPAEYRKEWETWLNLDADDEGSWSTPTWAQRLNGSPTQVTFELPEPAYLVIAPGPQPPPAAAQRSCNRHSDCGAADAEAKKRGQVFGAEHCHDECCEECFGN